MSSAVGLARELNPRYWELLEDAEELTNRWQRLNINLNTFKVPRLPFFGAKAELKKIHEPFPELQADTNRWLSRAGGFFVRHAPRLEPGQDHALTILWVQAELNMRIRTMQELKFITHYSFRFLGDAIDQRQNFAIAIASCLLAVTGLLITFLSG